MAYLLAFFGPLVVGLALFRTVVREGYRVWPIWLIGLPLILVTLGLMESAWLGIPWASVISGEASRPQDKAVVQLGILFLVLLNVLSWISWSLAALLANLFKLKVGSERQQEFRSEPW